jgi:hypothetical protein
MEWTCKLMRSIELISGLRRAILRYIHWRHSFRQVRKASGFLVDDGHLRGRSSSGDGLKGLETLAHREDVAGLGSGYLPGDYHDGRLPMTISH